MSASHWQVAILGTALASPWFTWWLSALLLAILVCAAAFTTYVGHLESNL